jgi:hypothetical protein
LCFPLVMLVESCLLCDVLGHMLSQAFSFLEQSVFYLGYQKLDKHS